MVKWNLRLEEPSVEYQFSNWANIQGLKVLLGSNCVSPLFFFLGIPRNLLEIFQWRWNTIPKHISHWGDEYQTVSLSGLLTWWVQTNTLSLYYLKILLIFFWFWPFLFYLSHFLLDFLKNFYIFQGFFS